MTTPRDRTNAEPSPLRASVRRVTASPLSSIGAPPHIWFILPPMVTVTFLVACCNRVRERDVMVTRTRFDDSECPVARSVDAIGDWWSLLIVRDAFDGSRRFGEFQRSLGVAKNILTARLRALVAGGVLESVPASDGSAYREYVLTPKAKRSSPSSWHCGSGANRISSPPRTTLTVGRPPAGTSPPRTGSAVRGRATAEPRRHHRPQDLHPVI
ncbi:helix-turn-helix domain-containing protein [Streptosporangium vulgare]|uniref:winged helix-turn-helix transcriptional regulator n=1 Tax=Streptosporangium vulgare TaxID=46190 RepID=UPI0031DC1AE5